jgi:predicted acylesterase/phospholipase RssA
MNKFQVIDFSYKTHPNQSLVEACYMSCCYPFGFTPIYRDSCCYIDGGIINDYPVNDCLNDQKCNIDEILGIKMLWEKKPANLSEKSSVLQFISTFFNQIKANLFENRPTKPIPNEVVCVSKVFSSQDWINWVKDENYRRELVLRGETFANVFLSYRRNFKESRQHQHKPHEQQQQHQQEQIQQPDTNSSKYVIPLPVGDTEELNGISIDPDNIKDAVEIESFEIHNNADMTMV